MKELVHLAFEDEVGKEFSKAIVESGAFRVKGR